jgi:hypothetical protein
MPGVVVLGGGGGQMLKCQRCWRGFLVCTICYNVPRIHQRQSKVLNTSILVALFYRILRALFGLSLFSPHQHGGICPTALSCPLYDDAELSTRAYLFRVPFYLISD